MIIEVPRLPLAGPDGSALGAQHSGASTSPESAHHSELTPERGDRRAPAAVYTTLLPAPPLHAPHDEFRKDSQARLQAQGRPAQSQGACSIIILTARADPDTPGRLPRSISTQ